MTSLRSRKDAQAGTSVVEMVVVVSVVLVLMLGFFDMSDSASHINKTQSGLADLQQSLRYAAFQVTRNSRMAGAGPIPIEQSVLARDAVTGNCYDNVGVGPCAAIQLTDGDNKQHPVRAGTDVLEIRGVLSTPLFAMGPPGGCNDGGCQGSGTIVTIPGATTLGVDNKGSFGLLSQFAPPQLFVVIAGSRAYNVGRATAWSPQGQDLQVTVDFTDAFARTLDGIPAPASPAQLGATMRAGVMDDYLYFIDAIEPAHPSLSVARRSPSPGSVRYDVTVIASDIEDMQVAYGIDSNADNAIGPPIGVAAGDDEWFGNIDDEVSPTVAQIQGTPATVGLHAVMVSLVARGASPDMAVKGQRGSLGIKTMNSAAGQVSPTIPCTRRAATWRINLRNFVYQGV